jgi:phytoene/squalene synthetase
MDLEQTKHDLDSYKKYIYGSAEVVGLMCLKVFVEGNEEKYEALKKPALALGAAFQKVNFLRDLRHDSLSLGRTYFPELESDMFDYNTKLLIEQDIEKDFAYAYTGIVQLPKSSRLGVYVAYIYYLKLFNKIKKAHAQEVLSKRIRIPDTQKIFLLTKSYFNYNLDLVLNFYKA